MEVLWGIVPRHCQPTIWSWNGACSNGSFLKVYWICGVRTGTSSKGLPRMACSQPRWDFQRLQWNFVPSRNKMSILLQGFLNKHGLHCQWDLETNPSLLLSNSDPAVLLWFKSLSFFCLFFWRSSPNHCAQKWWLFVECCFRFRAYFFLWIPSLAQS